MKSIRLLLFAFLMLGFLSNMCQAGKPVPPPVIGLCIAAPSPSDLDRFLLFMEEVLAPGGVNTLVLRVDYNYAYESFPNLRGDDPLTKMEVGRLVALADTLGIRLIPQINLLGHQSWHGNLGNLLREFPEFDETPSVELPERYEWPNEDGLYCKSYCPLHPKLHQVVLALVDEIMGVFGADAFHAGMDEVFYIGMEECSRCRGKDRSILFAGEVNLLRDHLATQGKELWIWGDRLIDGKTTGIGLWEASENDTHRAIDLISKDVVISDWHYERADPTAALFALKGFRVITCPWNRPDVTRSQLGMLDDFRTNTPEAARDRFYGIMQTVWSPADNFLESYYSSDGTQSSQAGSLNEIIRHYQQGND
jgi:hypothetical protein